MLTGLVSINLATSALFDYAGLNRTGSVGGSSLMEPLSLKSLSQGTVHRGTGYCVIFDVTYTLIFLARSRARRLSTPR